jgi:hypothetical protein
MRWKGHAITTMQAIGPPKSDGENMEAALPSGVSSDCFTSHASMRAGRSSNANRLKSLAMSIPRTHRMIPWMGGDRFGNY